MIWIGSLLSVLFSCPLIARLLEEPLNVRAGFTTPASLLKSSPGRPCISHVFTPSLEFHVDDGAVKKPLDDVVPRVSQIIDPTEIHARVFFNRHDYRMALLLLGEEIHSLSAKWIRAESLFRLKKYQAALPFFAELVRIEKDPEARQKAMIRIFDANLLRGDIAAAIMRYENFEKEYKNPPDRMRYGLGKALYDSRQVDRSREILRGIGQGNEFSLRARYIEAAIGLDAKNFASSLKQFFEIERSLPVSVEDHAVRELAMIAQGRIYAELQRDDLAEAAYLRVANSPELFEKAVIELVKYMLEISELARTGRGRFATMSAFMRERILEKALVSANNAIERFRKFYEIDWQRPELLFLMTTLLGESKRYDDARLAFSEFMTHFKRIESDLRDEKKVTAAIFPRFRREQRDNGTKMQPVVWGVPTAWEREIPAIQEILSLRDRIINSREALHALDEAMYLSGKDGEQFLTQQKNAQRAVEAQYDEIVLAKQIEISTIIADKIQQHVADAELRGACIARREIDDLAKQMHEVNQFQADNIEHFQRDLTDFGEGGSP